MFKPITTDPDPKDPCWIGTAFGGFNKCIVIDKQTGSVLPNCTGFAYGAWLASTGTTKCNLPTGDAGNWYRAVAGIYERGSTPKLGAVACWAGGTQGRGHVALVNEIDKYGNITVAESGYYSGIRYQTEKIAPPYNRNGLTLQGFIYNPNVEAQKYVIQPGKQISSYLGQAIIILGQRDEWQIGMISAAGEDPHTALQKIDQIDSDQVLIFGSMNSNYFQMRHDVEGQPYGEHYGTEISLQNEFCPHKGNVLAYGLRIGGESYCAPDDQFYWSKAEMHFACAPAYVPYMHGYRVDLWSEAFKSTKAVSSQQSMLIRTKDRYAFAVCQGQLTVSQLTEWAELTIEGLEDLCFMDSGGSSQLMIGYDCPVYTGREIPNVLSFYSLKEAHTEPSDEEGTIPAPEPIPGQDEDIIPADPGDEGEDDMTDNTGVPGMSNDTFDKLRYLAEFLLPALATLIIGIGELWNIPDAAKIAGLVTLIGSFIGNAVIRARKRYNAALEAKDE